MGSLQTWPSLGRISLNNTAPDAACGTCRANHGELPAPGGVIHEDAFWRLEHILAPIPMAGWLVLKPRRHVEALADLSGDEAAQFGPLVRRITRAMDAVMRPAKVYLCQFSEAEHFAHIHFHLIPRREDTPPEQRGPAVFALLSAARAGNDLAPVVEAERLAAAVRSRLLSQPEGEES
jgi:diadenosine tetraphosphate (Ap4A) HIT family hydrolase